MTNVIPFPHMPPSAARATVAVSEPHPLGLLTECVQWMRPTLTAAEAIDLIEQFFSEHHYPALQEDWQHTLEYGFPIVPRESQ